MTDDTKDQICKGIFFFVIGAIAYSMFEITRGNYGYFGVMLGVAVLLPIMYEIQTSKQSYKDRVHKQRLEDAKREAELERAKYPQPDKDPDARF